MNKMSWQDLFQRLIDKRDGKYQNLIQHIKDIHQQIEEKNETIRKKDEELNKIKTFQDQSEKYEKLKPEDFYDVIIKINSIRNLSEGWEISMNKKGEEKL